MERAINRNVVKRVALLCSLLLAFGTSYSQERLRPCQRYSGYESYQKMLTGYMVPEGNIEWLVLFMLGPERSICYNLSTHELVATSSREVICKDWFKGERSIQTDRKAVLIEESVASLLSSVFSKAVTTARRVEDEPVPDGTLPPPMVVQLDGYSIHYDYGSRKAYSNAPLSGSNCEKLATLSNSIYEVVMNGKQPDSSLLQEAEVVASLFSNSQTKDLSKMDDEERNVYLERMAREVTANFGPDYIKDGMTVRISDKKTFRTNKYIQDIPEYKIIDGKQYYSVTLVYNQELEKQPFTIASVTEILVDDGQPLSVMFGGGVGVEFIRHPYAEWVKEGIEEPYIIKFDHYEKVTEIVYPVK